MTTVKKTIKKRKKRTEETKQQETVDVLKNAHAGLVQEEVVSEEKIKESLDTENQIGLVYTEPKVEIIKPQVIGEAVVRVSNSTPTKAFAHSIFKFFKDYPNACLLAHYVGSGAGGQLTKAIIETNKKLVAEGKILSRYDFWSTENGKSIGNTRIIISDLIPNSVGQALVGENIEFVFVDLKGDETNGTNS